MGVNPAAVVLLHSPLVSGTTWGQLPASLRAAGLHVLVVDVTRDDVAPYAVRYVAAVAEQVAATGVTVPFVLVGHSGAGPLLPASAAALRARRLAPGGYIFLDAGLPRSGASRLALLESEDHELARGLQEHFATGGVFPDWSDDDLREAVPDDATRAALLASLRPRGREFFTEPLPGHTDWPDAPCGYLQLSPAYDIPARHARARGWPVLSRDTGHFDALIDPNGLATDLVQLIRRL